MILINRPICAAIVAVVSASTFMSFAIQPLFAETGGKSDRVDKINSALEEAEKKMTDQDTLIQRARSHLDAAESGSKGNPQQATELANQASLVYRDKREYLKASEMAHEALKIDPVNRAAAKLRKQIKTDLEERIAEAVPPGQEFTPPEGLLAYKIAVSDQVITLKEAEEVALKSQVLVRALEKKIKAAERKLTEAQRALFPTLSAEASANGGIVAGSAYQGESWKLNISHTIFDGGELLFTLRQATANLESEKAKFAKERSELLYRVGEAYRGVVRADYNFAYQNALYDDVQTIKIRTDKEHENKLASDIDYLEVMSTFNQIEYTKVSADADLKSARLILAQEMALDPDLPLPVDTTIRFQEVPVSLDTVRSMVQKSNWDIKIKELAAEGAFYGVRVSEAKKYWPKVEARGSVGLTGEAPVGAGFHNDLEDEHFIGFEGSMPLGGNSVDYAFTRRFFGPTVLSLTGSEDYRHRVTFNLLDKLSNLTDSDVAIADYLNAMADLEKERLGADVKVQEAFYDYKGSVLQMNTSLSKIKYREKQVNILKVTTGMQEASTSTLVNEMVQLSEDRFSYIKAVSDSQGALSNINRLIGIDNFYGSES